jgi:predicted ABC-type transport system involved in lysophospholipase L1 biosynthesis ATPase subunit
LVSASGEVNILRGLDLSITAGETIGVAGPSGSGKLTMMMVIDVTVIIPAIGAAGTWHTLG